MDRVLSLLSSLAGGANAAPADASSLKEAHNQVPPASPVVVGVRVQHTHSEGLLSPQVWTTFLDRLRTDAATDLRRRMAANIRRLADFADHVLAEGDGIARSAPTFSDDGSSILELSGVEEQVSTAFRRLVQHTVDQLAAHPLWADDLASAARSSAPVASTSFAKALDAAAGSSTAGPLAPPPAARRSSSSKAAADASDGSSTVGDAATESGRADTADRSPDAAKETTSVHADAAAAQPASETVAPAADAASAASSAVAVSDADEVRWTREALCECVEKLLASRSHAAMWPCFTRSANPGRGNVSSAATTATSAAPATSEPASGSSGGSEIGFAVQPTAASSCLLAARFQRRCELIRRLLGPEHLGLPVFLFDACYESTWALLRAELRRLASFHTPRDKLVALWNASRLLLGLLSASREREALAAALARADGTSIGRDAADGSASGPGPGPGESHPQAPSTPPPERSGAPLAHETPSRVSLGVGPGSSASDAAAGDHSDATPGARSAAHADDADAGAGAATAPHTAVAGPSLTPATADDLLPAAVLTIARLWPEACAAAAASSASAPAPGSIAASSESAAAAEALAGAAASDAAAASAASASDGPKSSGGSKMLPCVVDFAAHLRFIRAMRGSEALRSEAGYHLTAFESAVTLIMSDEHGGDDDDALGDGGDGDHSNGDKPSSGSGEVKGGADGNTDIPAGKHSRPVPVLLASKPNPAICAVDEHKRLLAAWQALEAELEAADGVASRAAALRSDASAAGTSANSDTSSAAASGSHPIGVAAGAAASAKSASARRGERLLACLLPPPSLEGLDISTPEGVDAAFKRWYEERAAFLSNSSHMPAAGDGPVAADIAGVSVAQAAALLTDYQHLLATVQRLREVALAEQ